jgi:allene oxide cyclase
MMSREIGIRAALVRRGTAVLAAVTLAPAALLAFGVGSASAAHAHRAGAGKNSTIHVIEHAVTDTPVNSGGPGDKTGNLLTFHNKVFNTKDNKQVGRDQGFCVRIVPGASYECMWTTFLAGGQITVEGPFLDKANSVLAITGGTGRFRGARGEMNLISRHGGAEFDFIFHLIG